MTAKKTGGSFALFVVMASCSGEHQPNGMGNDGEELVAVPESAVAYAEVAALRTRHRFAAKHRDASGALPAEAQTYVIGPSLAVDFRRHAERLIPAFPDETRDRRVKVELARRATEAFRIEDLASGVALSPRLVAALASEAEVTEGYVVYRGAAPGGGALVHRVTEEGTEDYLTFESAPAVEEAIYDVELSSAVAGLRLVERTLEALDASGTPRLRVAPPFIVGADGERRDANLEVSRCNVDTNPSEPWGRSPIAPGSSHCTVRVSWASTGVTYPALLDPSWNTAGNMTRRRWLAAATLLQNGKVLVSGGETTGFVTTQTAELYDPTTKTWAATGSMQTPRRQHRSLRLPSNNVLVSGGTISAPPFSVWATSERYSQTSGTWSAPATMGHPRWQHTMTLLTNGNVLVAGGALSQTPKAEIYNPTTNAFSPTTDMLSTQQGHTATLLNNGRVLVVGNDPNATEIHSQLYNPSNATWTITSPVNVRRINHTATLLGNGTVLVAGGIWPGGQFGDFIPSRAAEIYDPVANTWTRTGSTTYAHTDGTANLLSSGRVLLVGEDMPGSPRTTPEVFNPTWGTWAPTPPNASSRSGHVAVRLNSNRILVAGGDLFNTGTNAEEFDPTTTATTATEYKIETMIHPDVLSDRVTELWAVVHRPATLAAQRYPLLLFLHGQHETCGTGSNPRIDDNSDYALNGTCPGGYDPVPNHRGYDYIASELASRGYIVVSVNSNRGINWVVGMPEDDPSFILARGRLVLKHMQRISEWDRGTRTTPSTIGVSLRNRIDFSQVGLMGHSRGGEGVRAAYEQYRDAGSPWPGRIVTPVNFRGIFEIGSTDMRAEGVGDNVRVLNALNTKWAALFPMCDHDMAHLPSVAVFDRMHATFNETNPSFKATYQVWGANHNFYNTEWQRSDAFDCFGEPGDASHRPMFLPPQEGVTGSAEQRQSGFYPMLAFFTANVGPAQNPALNNVFDPKTPIVSELPIQRGYTPGANTSHSRQLEDFLRATGTSTFNQPNVHSNITISHEVMKPHQGVATYHDPDQRAGLVSWSSPGSNVYFQSNFAAPGSGLPLTSYQMLDIRVERSDDFEKNTEPLTRFEVALVTPSGGLSNRVWIDGYGLLKGPARGQTDGFHRLLQTNRIPLSAFGVNLNSIRGVRLIFSGTPTGSIWVANIRASRVTTP